MAMHADWPTADALPEIRWLQDEEKIWYVVGHQCKIWIAERPAYCDRGNYLANLQAWGNLALDIDESDLWPRYYFDLDRCKAEVAAWMVKRKQATEGNPT